MHWFVSFDYCYHLELKDLINKYGRRKEIKMAKQEQDPKWPSLAASLAVYFFHISSKIKRVFTIAKQEDLKWLSLVTSFQIYISKINGIFAIAKHEEDPRRLPWITYFQMYFLNGILVIVKQEEDMKWNPWITYF